MLAQIFHSVRTVGNKAIQLSGVDYMQPDILYTIVLTNISITGKNHDAAKRTISQILQGLLQKIASLALIHSSVSTTKVTTKWTVTNILIGTTILTRSDMIGNNRNSTNGRVQ